MSSPMAAAVIGAIMPCAPVFTHGMLPPHPSSAHAQPSIPSVDRVLPLAAASPLSSVGTCDHPNTPSTTPIRYRKPRRPIP